MTKNFRLFEMEFLEECPICLNEYDKDRQPIFLMPCKHAFCKQCVSILISKDCPFCRIQFDGAQKDFLFINNFSVQQLNKIESNLDEKYQKTLEIFNQNSKNLANIKQIFQLNFDQLTNNEFKTDFRELFNSKVKIYKMDEVKFYFISLKYSAFKEEIKNKIDIVKSFCNQVFEFSSLDEFVERMERFLEKENLVQHIEFLDAKKFYQDCYSEFVLKKFGYLKDELEKYENLLDCHFKSNNEIFLRNNEQIKQVISKIELKKLPKDINSTEFKEMVNEKLHVKLLITSFENFEKKYQNLKTALRSKQTTANDLAEFCEYDLLDQKSQIEDLIIKVNLFIKLNKIEKLNFKPFETSYFNYISDYRSMHSRKKFDKYKVINYFFKI